MKYCIYCGNAIPEGEKKCLDCERKKLIKSKAEVEKTETNSDIIDSKRQNNNGANVYKDTYVKSNKTIGEKLKDWIIKKWNGMDLFCKLSTIFIILGVVLFLVARITHNTLPLVISIFQLIMTVAGLLFHKNVIKIDKKYPKYLLLVGALLLVALNIYSYRINKNIKPLISIPHDAEYFEGKYYAEAGMELKDAGFSNIAYEEIEDVDYDKEPEKVGIIENISINGKTKFSDSKKYKSDSKIVITYHTCKKISVNIHVKFEENWILDKYGVNVFWDDEELGKLSHGKDGDFGIETVPGTHEIKFISKDDSSVLGKKQIDVDGELKVSYKITTHSDEVSVKEQYVERYSKVGTDDVMILKGESKYEGKNISEVEPELKELGFTNISYNVKYDIVLGITDSGEISKVSIDGNSDFKHGDIFPSDAEVIITYHDWEDNDPNKQSEPGYFSDNDEDNSITDIDITNASSDTNADSSTTYSVNYSTNDSKTVKDGNKGVYSYRKAGGVYDLFYIIDFDEGYVYFFQDGDGNTNCEKYKIKSGTLNGGLTYNYDGCTYKLYFKYENSPATLILADPNGFDWEYKTTGLEYALEVRNRMNIIEY